MNRWRWLGLLGLLGLLGSLIACGRSEGGSSTGSQRPPNGKLITVYPSPEQPRPTATPYQPMRQDTALIIDLPIAALQPTVYLTMDISQTLQFASSMRDTLLEWNMKFDPLVWEATAQGVPIVSDGVMQSDPPATIRLVPQTRGSTKMRIFLRYDPCRGCETVWRETNYEITIQ
ncbi:hypothetical protein Hgul01_04653 [Herpetosiphon gulosus]|uniref:Lipoprotein n=2 Tax=Herpetosiphon gulosus TaxID=1973496 RepID=A0ABP9X8E4_9CHLR